MDLEFLGFQPEESEIFTLSELLTRVQMAMEAYFPSFFWVVAEVAELQKNRGHVYLELVERENESVKARVRGIIWSSRSSSILAIFAEITGQELKAGMKVLLKGKLRFHPAYGLSFEIQWIDPTYSLGEMARRRREILRRLEEEGVLEQNRRLPFPLVPQRVAVVSSEHSAGFEDFWVHLQENPYGFAFAVKLFPALVQGEEAEASLLWAFEEILAEAARFDVVVLLRGGGSRVDLSCFDSYSLGKMVAGFPLPVLTGIGHHRDESVVDCVAHQALKTPTAVADFLVNRVRNFEEMLEEQASLLWEMVWERLARLRAELNGGVERFRSNATLLFQREWEKHLRLEERFALIVRAFLERHRAFQEEFARSIRRETVKRIEEEKHFLSKEEQALALLHPLNVLRRGYT
ncbi:MAG: exodeoxyribonuclease VII large subunit, partial [Candidatus Caldatribacteriaceae bacterium]